MTSRWQGAPYSRGYDRELVSKPAISLRIGRGGATVERLLSKARSLKISFLASLENYIGGGGGDALSDEESHGLKRTTKIIPQTKMLKKLRRF